ncbi:MAG: winged helix-turn-helix transcriptional regulator [Thermodesulfovibrionales bacterium]|nr:winged helix-turn-helix transcriptional regulator [Thermodesulfovibrionales bacterium]
MLERFENSTVWKLLLLLKKNGEMSIEEMSNALNITPIGIRQHILSLERNGFVSYRMRKKGVGRPGYIYSLTNKAEELFPNNYKNFILEVFKEIEDDGGREHIDRLFKKRKDRLFKHFSSILGNVKNFKTRLSLFLDSLKEQGYILETQERLHDVDLIQFNCPISAVSSHYREVCKYELELYRDLFGTGVDRLQCVSEGGRYCSYRIPKTN